jgi:Zn-dependent peptidase ImmA (M78 family)
MIVFYDRCCEIRLPCDCEEMDDIKIRQILAHELGHLIYNMDNLKTPEVLEQAGRTDAEELFAWEFAFYLIKKKSDEHRSNREIGRHIFTLDELKQSIISLVRKKKPEILDELTKSINNKKGA